MDIDSALSKYLKTGDLGGQTRTATIRDVTMQEVGENNEVKPIMYFHEYDKGVVINATKRDVLKAAYGKETAKWGGYPVELSPGTTHYGSKIVECINFTIPAAAPTTKPDDQVKAPF